MTAALEALRARRSHSKVNGEAPTSAELAELVSAMSSIADHSDLRPWRLIELRGDARLRLGRALADAAGKEREKLEGKALRAPLVIAIVVSPRESRKVPRWEQEAVASGVAHALELLLAEAGWGCMWRTGLQVRSEPVHQAHDLEPHEYLLGWLYVGGVDEKHRKEKPRKPLDPAKHLSALPAE